jgi:thiamine-phosphate pyrophosphorylase
MSPRHPNLPDLWLVTDARNDHALETALARLPRGSGVIFRHYHLGEAERRARFEELRRAAHRRGHVIFLSGTFAEARKWRADGAYGDPRRLAKGPALLRLATAHSLREVATARRARADAVLLSPVFATRSHPGAKALGPVRFRLMAALSGLPIIALGGMNRGRARRLKWCKWAAIDGFCDVPTRRIPVDS